MTEEADVVRTEEEDGELDYSQNTWTQIRPTNNDAASNTGISSSDVVMSTSSSSSEPQNNPTVPDVLQRSSTPNPFSSPLTGSSISSLDLQLPCSSSSSVPQNNQTVPDVLQRSSTPSPLYASPINDPLTASSDSSLDLQLPCSSSSSKPPNSFIYQPPPTAMPSDISTQSELCSGSVSQECSCHCKELTTRVQQLEEKVDMLLDQQQHRTPKKLTFKPAGSAQKGEFVQIGKLLGGLYVISERVLLDFEVFRLGPRTGRKDKDNACQARSHALRFCTYMLAGCSDSAGVNDLKFLGQMDKLCMWPLYLANKGYAPTSIECMLRNVKEFLKRVENSFRKDGKLNENDFSKLAHELKRLQAEVAKEVTVHWRGVLCRKPANSCVYVTDPGRTDCPAVITSSQAPDDQTVQLSSQTVQLSSQAPDKQTAQLSSQAPDKQTGELPHSEPNLGFMLAALASRPQ
ncbi:uncharacterized protein AKAME5_000000100, partial [Lates japonicus]